MVSPEAAQEKPRQSKKPRKPSLLSAAVKSIYAAYPLKVKRPQAMKAIKKAIERIEKRPGIADPPGWILAKVQEYAAAVSAWPKAERQFIPYPASWFNGERYDDDPDAWKRSGTTSTTRGNTANDGEVAW